MSSIQTDIPLAAVHYASLMHPTACFRYNNRIRLGVDDVQRVNLIVAGAKGKRLTYRTVGGKVAV